MKRCPSCLRTYPDDAPDYCPNDGQRLVRQEAATFDPEKTVTSSGISLDEVAPPEPPAAAQPQQPSSAPTPPVQTASPPIQSEPPRQQEQPPAGEQFQQPLPQAPAPFQQPPPQQPPPAWGSQYPQPAPAPFGAPNAQAPFGGRRKAFAIGSLVLGVDVATFMAVTIIRDRNFLYILMLVLSSFSILLGIAALFLAIKSPARFGGVELAIVGLALGVAGLVYFLLNQG